MLRRAHDAGLTEEDLGRMSFDEYFAWLELNDWMLSPEEDEDEDEQLTLSAQEGMRAFFHLN